MTAASPPQVDTPEAPGVQGEQQAVAPRPPLESPREVVAFIERVWPALDQLQRRRMITSVHGITKRTKGFRYRPGVAANPSWRPAKHVDAALQGLELVASADPRVVRRERRTGEAAFPYKVMAMELVMHAPGTELLPTSSASTVSLSMMYTGLLSRLVEHVNDSDEEEEERGTLVWHGARDGVASLPRSRGSGVACDRLGLEQLKSAARAMRDRLAVPAA